MAMVIPSHLWEMDIPGVQCPDGDSTCPKPQQLRPPRSKGPYFLHPGLLEVMEVGQRVAAGAPCAGQELLLESVADVIPLLAKSLVVGSCGFWQGQLGLGTLWPWLKSQPPKSQL